MRTENVDGAMFWMLFVTLVCLLSIISIRLWVEPQRPDPPTTTTQQSTRITSDPTANYLIDPTGCGCVPLPEAAR